MADFKISLKWQYAQDLDILMQDASAYLGMEVDGTCLTRCEDVWSHTVREDTLVSAYSFARWLAVSWWRLNHEPLLDSPGMVWRQTHELAGAGDGYVWPRLLFAPDGENMNVWASPLRVPEQSVSYLAWLDHPALIPIAKFQAEAQKVIEATLCRLAARGHAGSDLEKIWALVLSERENPELVQRRVLEARLGFDPDECPSEILDQMLGLQNQTGGEAISELAPVLGRCPQEVLKTLDTLTNAQGLRGRFTFTDVEAVGDWHPSSVIPWQQGTAAARMLRARLSNPAELISCRQLSDLVGLTLQEVEGFNVSKNPVAIVRSSEGGGCDFVLRKAHPLARRFEIARLIGDAIMARQPYPESRWLVSADTATVIQKRQRAFAAEFLCPIDALQEFLNGDFSETAQEKAADHFQVSDKTVESILVNHGEIARLDSPFFPMQPENVPLSAGDRSWRSHAL